MSIHRGRNAVGSVPESALTLSAVLAASLWMTPAQSRQVDAPYLALRAEAYALSNRPYAAYRPAVLPAFDPPEHNRRLGLDYSEYLALLTRWPFFDDGHWWLKQRPRGNVEKIPVDIWYTRARGGMPRQLKFKQSDYTYGTRHIVPGLPQVLPDAAQRITALAVGHRHGNGKSWPQVLHIGGNAYARISGYDGEFSTSLRFGTHHALTDHETFPSVRRLHLHRPNREVLTMLALVDSDVFTAALEMTFRPGNASELDVVASLYPRLPIPAAELNGVGPLAFSSMYWKGPRDTPQNPHDEAHDADVFEYCATDGTRRRVELAIPARGARPLTLSAGATRCFGLLQQQRDAAVYTDYAAAQYARRSSIRIDNVSSTLPFDVQLAQFFTDYEGHDNVVVFVAFKGPFAPVSDPEHGISFKYRVEASMR